MTKHPAIGIEFNLWGYEIPGSRKDTDFAYAFLVTKILTLAEEEGFLLDVPKIEGIDDKPLLERMDELARADRRVGLMYDHEVPVVLGMSRIALANLVDKDRDRTLDDSYRFLPSPATMKILIGSLEEYEELRQVD